MIYMKKYADNFNTHRHAELVSASLKHSQKIPKQVRDDECITEVETKL